MKLVLLTPQQVMEGQRKIYCEAKRKVIERKKRDEDLCEDGKVERLKKRYKVSDLEGKKGVDSYQGKNKDRRVKKRK